MSNQISIKRKKQIILKKLLYNEIIAPSNKEIRNHEIKINKLNDKVLKLRRALRFRVYYEILQKQV